MISQRITQLKKSGGAFKWRFTQHSAKLTLKVGIEWQIELHILFPALAGKRFKQNTTQRVDIVISARIPAGQNLWA